MGIQCSGSCIAMVFEQRDTPFSPGYMPFFTGYFIGRLLNILFLCCFGKAGHGGGRPLGRANPNLTAVLLVGRAMLAGAWAPQARAGPFCLCRICLLCPRKTSYCSILRTTFPDSEPHARRQLSYYRNVSNNTYENSGIWIIETYVITL